jgi:RNA processing factor Prp31
LSQKGVLLQEDYQKNSVVKTRNYSKRGRSFVMQKQYFFIKKSKTIIDEIDKLLASHYGFTEEELDFIINYDIKYRMGDELNEE